MQKNRFDSALGKAWNKCLRTAVSKSGNEVSNSNRILDIIPALPKGNAVKIEWVRDLKEPAPFKGGNARTSIKKTNTVGFRDPFQRFTLPS